MTDQMPQTFSREVFDLFDAYVHGDLSRRGFLDGAARHLGSAGAATAVLAALSPDFAGAQVVKADDQRIRVRRAEIPSPGGSGSINAYVAEPAGRGGKHGVVLVVHENRGLNPHIEDIARRLAVDGFVAVAPDALTKLGGYPGDEDKARELFPKLDQTKIVEDFVAAAKWAEALPEGNGKLGAGGLLLWRRGGQHARHAPARAARRGALLRPDAARREGGADQGDSAGQLCRQRYAPDRPMARLRRRAHRRARAAPGLRL